MLVFSRVVVNISPQGFATKPFLVDRSVIELSCGVSAFGKICFNRVKGILICIYFNRKPKCMVNRLKRAGYTLDIMRHTACLVFNPIMVEGYAAHFSCTAVAQASDSMAASMLLFNSWLKLDDCLWLDPP